MGVVAPGFAVRAAALRRGVARLESMGFRVRTGPHVLARDGYLAGPDDDRASDLRAMLDDPGVRAVWFARGGYGVARILDRVSWRRFARAPKLLVGYSDLTALFARAVRVAGPTCIYGPVVTELGAPDAYHEPSLRSALAGKRQTLRFTRRQVVCAGRARGPVVGGNLTVLVHLLGTRHAPDLRGAILFLEDVGEPVYRIDRMLTQLRQTGALRAVAGVALGSFCPPPRRRFPPDRSLGEVLAETFAPLGVPVVVDLPAGHVKAKRSVPLGAVAELSTRSGWLRFEP